MLRSSRGTLEIKRYLKLNLERTRKILKKSHRKGFFLFTDNTQIRNIDLGKKTKLWLSSTFLLEELFKESPEKAIKKFQDLLLWNEKMEKYKECEKLVEMLTNLKQR